jgi:hypothetical protein
MKNPHKTLLLKKITAMDILVDQSSSEEISFVSNN